VTSRLALYLEIMAVEKMNLQIEVAKYSLVTRGNKAIHKALITISFLVRVHVTVECSFINKLGEALIERAL
jgi:hypothetical protein